MPVFPKSNHITVEYNFGYKEEGDKLRLDFSGQAGKTHSRIALAGTCLVSKRTKRTRLELLSLASRISVLIIDIPPSPPHSSPQYPLKGFEMFSFHNGVEMEYFCNLRMFHRLDNLFPA